MSSSRHDRVYKLFLDVCDLSPAELTTVLDRECAGDPDLRAEVEALLRKDAEASGLQVTQRLGALRATLDVLVLLPDGLKIVHGLIRHAVVDVQAVNLVEVLAQVAQHESDHFLRVLAPAFSFRLRANCRNRQARHRDGDQRRSSGDRRHPSRLALHFTAHEFVEADVQ